MTQDKKLLVLDDGFSLPKFVLSINYIKSFAPYLVIFIQISLNTAENVFRIHKDVLLKRLLFFPP